MGHATSIRLYSIKAKIYCNLNVYILSSCLHHTNLLMKKIAYLLFVLLPVFTHAQVITTIAGVTGTHGYGQDEIEATMTPLNFPEGVAIDNLGNVYVADYWNARVRMISPDGIIHAVAGNGSFARTGDGGPATAAGINFPMSLTFDGLGNLYIACDSVTDAYTTHYVICCSNIRKVNTAGIITTIAGVGAIGFNGDGIPAIGAGFNLITGIAADTSGNVYLNVSDNRIRKINSAGIISTIAGDGTPGFSGDGGPAADAIIHNQGGGIALDHSGNIFFSDRYNNRIRKISTAGMITTFAGNASFGYSGDGGAVTTAKISGPWGLAFDNDDNLFFSDLANNVIREINNTGIITTVAGKGIHGYSGDGGHPDSAEINDVMNVGVDKLGNLYLPDVQNENIRLVSKIGLATPLVDLVNELWSFKPNPAATKLCVAGECIITELRISNMLGQTVYTGGYKGKVVQVDIANLPIGVYFIQINNSEIRKFVKQ